MVVKCFCVFDSTVRSNLQHSFFTICLQCNLDFHFSNFLNYLFYVFNFQKAVDFRGIEHDKANQTLLGRLFRVSVLPHVRKFQLIMLILHG